MITEAYLPNREKLRAALPKAKVDRLNPIRGPPQGLEQLLAWTSCLLAREYLVEQGIPYTDDDLHTWVVDPSKGRIRDGKTMKGWFEDTGGSSQYRVLIHHHGMTEAFAEDWRHLTGTCYWPAIHSANKMGLVYPSRHRYDEAAFKEGGEQILGGLHFLEPVQDLPNSLRSEGCRVWYDDGVLEPKP